MEHQYAIEINRTLGKLIPEKKEEIEVVKAANQAVKEFGEQAAESKEQVTTEFKGFATSFTGPIKQALASGGDIGKAFKSGARALFERITSKFLDAAFKPLEEALDRGLEKMFSSAFTQINNASLGGGGGGGGVGGSILSGLLGGGGGGGLGSIGGMLFGGFSKGGIVPEVGKRPQYFARGGFAQGTDTVPAMLTPGEMVLTKDQQDALLGGGGGVTINQTLNITEATDPQKFKEELVKNNKVIVGLVQQSYQKRARLGPQGYGQ